MKHACSLSKMIVLWGLYQMIPCTDAALPAGLPHNARQIQCCLRPDEVILEYVATDSSVMINAIAHGSRQFSTHSLDPLFWHSLQAFRKDLGSAEAENFKIHAEILYLYLVTPVRGFLKDSHRLIIIPGNWLEGIPFEAFIRNDGLSGEGNTSGGLHYLVRDFEVVYHTTLSQWYEAARKNASGQSVTPDECTYAFMGFSPAVRNSRYLPALNCSMGEITRIGEMFLQKGLTSRIITGASGCKESFKWAGCGGKIVHLAAHYLRCDKYRNGGGFQFTDPGLTREEEPDSGGTLSPGEIASMYPDADLMVLNGCATGADCIVTDSARQSLPQLLSSAGARNVLSTLWNVTDNLAGQFMVDFYRALLSGRSYSEALREVKLTWISRRETTLPTIWAPYVLTGR